jgi:hypothetical protein
MQENFVNEDITSPNLDGKDVCIQTDGRFLQKKLSSLNRSCETLILSVEVIKKIRVTIGGRKRSSDLAKNVTVGEGGIHQVNI